MEYLTTRRSRLYPNLDTRLVLNKTIGCSRFIWNALLGNHKEEYGLWVEDPETHPKPSCSLSSFNQKLNELKVEYPWLNEVSSVALQQTVLHLTKAFSEFFQGIHGYPKFKSKRDPGGFNLSSAAGTLAKDGKIRIPKIKGYTTCRPKLPLDQEIRNYSIVKDRVGNYFVNCLVTKPCLPNTAKGQGLVGVDLGIKSLAVAKRSTGEIFTLENPRTYMKYHRKRVRLQRRLAKKQKGSQNRNKARIKLAKLERKVGNIRKNTLDTFTSKLISENQVIGIEDLNVKGMLKNSRLAKHIQDCGFSTLRRMLEHKAKRYESPVIISLVHRFYPSTQCCSACGIKREIKLTLNDREWTCAECGTSHDRDINAATNILYEGLRLVV